MGWRAALLTSAAAAVTAAVGTAGTDPDSQWYRGLDKPPWQPPPVAFPLVWTPLYADIAATTAVGLSRTDGAERSALARSLGVNLVLNAGWNWLFFTAHRPDLATVECAVLTASSARLTRQVAAADRRAGTALLPYPLWCAFATALSAAIWRRNR